MEHELAHTVERVLAQITPTQDECEGVSALANALTELCEESAREAGARVVCTLVGSVARGTWLKGAHDFDVFMLFPPELAREELERQGLELANSAAQKVSLLVGERGVEIAQRYAEHPYIQLRYADNEVDFVPAYNIDDPAHIISAVDRTPHHTRYVLSHIRGLEGEVRLLKQLFRAANIYGSELRRCGYSGYLCELLIIQYGSFIDCVKAIATWRRGVVIDIEKHSTGAHPEPLVVVDPVDPKRNVASALSLDNFALSIHMARALLKAPSTSLFEPCEEGYTLEPDRGTGLVALEFSRPDLVDDVLYPQIYHAMKSVATLLEREGFRVYSRRVGERKGHICMLFELEVYELPSTRKHMGPPVELKEHAERFLELYEHHPHALSELYIENGRYCIDLKREYPRADMLLKAGLEGCGLGKQLKRVLVEDAVVLSGVDVVETGRVFEVGQ